MTVREWLQCVEAGMEDAHALLRVVMITSAENRAWPADVPMNKHEPFAEGNY